MVFGGLTKEAVKEALNAQIGLLGKCYEQALPRASNPSGKASVKFVVGPEGTVLSATVVRLTVRAPGFKECIRKEVMTWAFPKALGGEETTVTYPFWFRPRPVALPDGGVAPESSAEPLPAAFGLRRAEIRSCYEEELTRSPDYEGEVRTVTEIDPQGRVVSIEVNTDGPQRPELQACMIERIRAWPFRPPQGGRAMTVRYSYTFRRGSADSGP